MSNVGKWLNANTRSRRYLRIEYVGSKVDAEVPSQRRSPVLKSRLPCAPSSSRPAYWLRLQRCATACVTCPEGGALARLYHFHARALSSEPFFLLCFRDTAHLAFGAMGWTGLSPIALADSRMEADEDVKYLEEILSKEGAKMYKQYWPALQLAADYFAFEMDPLINEPAKWAKFEDLFRESGARGGQVRAYGVAGSVSTPFFCLLYR
eukprot:scaffold7366_cov254-Pinguiococcus_pyrenoidosus.AAC.17